MRRYNFIGVAAALIASAGAGAQSYPAKPVRLIVPFAAGGGADYVGRIVGQKFLEALGQPLIIDNRGGAGGAIGTELAAKAPADGYTLLLGSAGPLTIQPGLSARLPYDPIKDLAPITLVSSIPYVMVVHPSLPARSLRELVSLARAKPGQLNFGSPGNGTTTHLATELFKQLAKVDVVHVPYKGVAPAVNDLLAGQTQFMSGDLSTLMPQVKAARLRALGVTGATRSALAPELPTIAEAGLPGYEAIGWFAVLAPAATPREIATRLHAAIAKGITEPDARDKLAALGGDVVASTPAEFAARIREDLAKWSRLIRTIGLKAEQPG